MQTLSKALETLQSTLSETESPCSSSLMQAPSLTKSAGEMIIANSTPRQEPLTVEKAKSAWAWLQRLKLCRKTTWEKINNVVTRSISYTLPDDITPRQAIVGLTECVRPCSPMVTKHFVSLQAFKPFFDADKERIQIVFSGLYNDIKALPELSAVIALDELRQRSDIKYFPTELILPAVKEYADTIYDAMDYFKEQKDGKL